MLMGHVCSFPRASVPKAGADPISLLGEIVRPAGEQLPPLFDELPHLLDLPTLPITRLKQPLYRSDQLSAVGVHGRC